MMANQILQKKQTPFDAKRTQLLRSFEKALEQKLTALRRAYPHSPEMVEAVIYSTLVTGGKRIRPLLSYAAAEAAGAAPTLVEDAAVAIELIHCYSLIHDDLPFMDDDDMRRNMPSCHKKFGEANAILAGDMLHVLAFDQLMRNTDYAISIKQQMMQVLIRAALDMVSGQALDVVGETRQLSKQEIEKMYELKTAALITAAMQLGALTRGEQPEIMPQLTAAGKQVGVAFQIQDDFLDLATENVEQEKSTYPKVAGLVAAKERKQQLLQDALRYIARLGERAAFLRYLFTLMVERSI